MMEAETALTQRRTMGQFAAAAVAAFLYVLVGLRLLAELLEGRPLGSALSRAVRDCARDAAREPGLHLALVAAVVAFTLFSVWIASRTRRIIGFGVLVAPALVLTAVVVNATLSKDEGPRACSAGQGHPSCR